jgi:hypothetical protein
MIDDQTDTIKHGRMTSSGVWIRNIDAPSDFEKAMWAKHREHYRERALHASLCIGAILGLSLILWAAIWEAGTRLALWILS